nr:cyclin-D-binding Myb-like transcription factor 1 isoform X3 [Arachis hypogaea]
MDEKVKKSKTEEICLEPNDRKKDKHMKKKKKHRNDKALDSDKILEGNCIDDDGERQACSNDKFTRNKEEDGNISKKLKKKRIKDTEVLHNAIVDDKILQVMDDNQKSKRKKRKICSDSLTAIQEIGSSKPKKRGKVVGNYDFKDHEGDPPLARISTGDANAHSLVNEVDDQGEKTEKNKKELREKGDYFVVPSDRQDKETEKVIINKVKRIEEDDCKTNKGDTCFAESIVADTSLVKSNEGEDHQGKKMKKKKKLRNKSKSKFESTEDDQHCAEANEGEDNNQGRQRKKKLSNKRKSKDKSEFKSSKDDQHCANGNEGDDDNLGKKMKNGKQSEESKSNERNEVNDQGRKTKINKKTKEGTTSKLKRVTFSDQVEVCGDGLIRWQRYTNEEDEKIKQAVFDYIETHKLGDEGLDMVLYNKHHPELKNCWKEIGVALPHRPYISVYYRAHILFTRDEKHTWTAEEVEFLKKTVERHGSDFKSIAEAMGKNRLHVKDQWRRIKMTRKRGAWSQEEYQKVFDLVSVDLRARALEDTRNKKHGMLRDNIGWEAISDKLGTRWNGGICQKWYSQLTSPMVDKGIWSDTDDYRLVDALFSLDACSMEEVDWDNLLEHRDGELCRKRWNQMVRYIGEHGRKSFTEQVEILAKRYCPDLLEAREAFDSQPVICGRSCEKILP